MLALLIHHDLQETLSVLQDLEEHLLESHSDFNRDVSKWPNEYEKIFEETSAVDYDREGM